LIRGRHAPACRQAGTAVILHSGCL